MTMKLADNKQGLVNGVSGKSEADRRFAEGRLSRSFGWHRQFRHGAGREKSTAWTG